MDGNDLHSIFYLFVTFSMLQIGATCPLDCMCTDFSVKCNPGLTTIPTDLKGNSDVPKDGRFLDFSGMPFKSNNFRSLEARNLSNFRFLMELRLSYCNIETIAEQTFSNYKYLFRLDLSNNKLSSLNKRIFEGSQRLRKLELSGNTNCIIEGGTFAVLPGLRELYLGDMGLTWLNPDVFSGLENLESLYIDRNNIFNIEVELNTLFPSLTHFDISYNNLWGFSGANVNFIIGLTSVLLEGNPLQCNCEIIPIKQHMSTVLGGAPLVCAGPDKLRNQLVSQVADQNMLCLQPTVDCPLLSIETVAMCQLNISCNVSGDPLPRIIWTSPSGEHLRFTHNTPGRLSVDRGGGLHLFNVSTSDGGPWTIQVSNEHGLDEKTLQLKVNLPTTTTTTTTTTTPTTTTATTSARGIKDNDEISVESGENTMMIAGAAGGAGLLFLVISIIVYAMKKKDKDKIRPERPTDDGFDTVRSPRSTR